MGPVPLGEEPPGVGARYLVDVYRRVDGPGEPLGGHERLGQQGKDGRHADPVAPGERDKLGERLPERDLPHREPRVLVQKLPQLPHELAADLRRVAHAEALQAPQGRRGVALDHGYEQPREGLYVAPGS